jgi:hypothetical protein
LNNVSKLVSLPSKRAPETALCGSACAATGSQGWVASEYANLSW